ncbi:MAG: hypothetical protein ABWW69_03265 [Pyrodictiaceae archaeon]
MVVIKDGREYMRVRKIVNFTLREGDIVGIRSGDGERLGESPRA